MECKSCGRSIYNENANFCEYCGNSFRNINHIKTEAAQTATPVIIESEKPVSMANYLWSMSLMLIPLIGPLVYIIMLFVWSFNKETPRSKSNWAKAMLIFMLLSFIILVFSVTSLMNDPSYQSILNEMMKMYNIN